MTKLELQSTIEETLLRNINMLIDQVAPTAPTSRDLRDCMKACAANLAQVLTGEHVVTGAVAPDRFEVFTVSERNNKSYWTRLGRGYLNRDTSINLFLDALPTNGKLQVRAEAPETTARREEEMKR